MHGKPRTEDIAVQGDEPSNEIIGEQDFDAFYPSSDEAEDYLQPASSTGREISQIEPATRNPSKKVKTPRQGGTKEKFSLSKEKSILKAEQLPRVGGVCFDKNRQRWIAHWKVSGKYVKNYFPVSNYGFDEARQLAVNCRQDAEKRLNLPVIQLRKERSPAPKVSQSKKLNQGSADAFYDSSRKCWVALYTVYEEFPVANFGFTEARRRAFLCRKLHEFPEPCPRQDYLSDPMLTHHDTTRNGKTQQSTKLALEAIIILLHDLYERCIPNLTAYVSPEILQTFSTSIRQHQTALMGYTTLEELQHYLYLFQYCIKELLLPSDRNVQMQLDFLTKLQNLTP
ncbi:AP2 domain transcription factor AP2VIIa-9 [Cardiosporidium cionae]|uniref:AP2 domain transcription factor AP2VIIa-9 n=1 Tax=Cardiosporidium cionae TaxID=476202 RepID=A0ABQ7JGQ9_9APIC|nr:AP2 domain transcription factor AP2VIIa-9 [Cardiosporidium cionae]|eukprot:KAF8823095.1 AP2 domain transcription factor AP2VIIa-9 [Cardiosporidium cionae]